LFCCFVVLWRSESFHVMPGAASHRIQWAALADPSAASSAGNVLSSSASAPAFAAVRKDATGFGLGSKSLMMTKASSMPMMVVDGGSPPRHSPPGGCPFGRRRRPQQLVAPAVVARPRQTAFSSSDGRRTPAIEIDRVASTDNAWESTANWKAVLELDARDAMEHEEADRRELMRRRREMVEVLESQTRHRRHAREQDQHDEREWGKWLKADAVRNKAEEKQTKQEVQDRNIRFSEERLSQIEAGRRRREKDREIDRKLDRESASMSVEKARNEVAVEDEKKRVEQDKLAELAGDRRTMTLQKCGTRQIEVATGKEALRHQRNKLEAQEKQRSLHYEMVQSKGAPEPCPTVEISVTAVARKAKEDHERARRFQEELTARMSQEAQDKVQRIKQDFSDDKVRVGKEKEGLTAKMTQEHLEAVRLSDHYRTDAKKEITEERNVAKQRFEKSRMNTTFLKDQMDQRPEFGKFGPEKMTEAEQAMNRQRVDRVKNETLVLGKTSGGFSTMTKGSTRKSMRSTL